MARKIINIGTTGNDATGDSIREGFNKVNQNFTEIYAALGLSGGLQFTALDDTPSALTSNKIITSNVPGDALIERTLEGDGIGVDFGSDPTKIILSNTGTEIKLDTTPELGGDVNAQGFLIENLGTPQKSGDAVTKKYADDKFVDAAGDIATGQIRLQDGSGNPRIPSLTDEAVNKQYADSKMTRSGDTMTGPLILSESPEFSSNVNQAATKGYVDSTSYTSTQNIYVSTEGRTEEQMKDAQIDQSQIGRSWANAFNSVREAAFYAERIVKGDIVLKEQGLLPATADVFFKVPGQKAGEYTVNLAADGTEDTTNVLANSLLTKNRRFIQEETIAFINAEINDGDDTDDFAGNFTYNQDKCYRDVGLIIDAVSFDLTYVGNSKTVDAALSYWDGATSRIAGQQTETVAAINFAKDLIVNNILTNTAYVPNTNLQNPFAVELIEENRDFVADETIAWIQDQIDGGAGIWSGFSYNEDKCRRDVGYILDGIAFDLKFGGNTKTRNNAAMYWDGVVSEVAGQQAQTVAALNFTRDLVRDYILRNLDWSSLQDPSVTATTQTKTANNGEAGASTKLVSLMNMLADVITNGLGNLPTLQGTLSNQSGVDQYIDTAIIAETGASTTITSLMSIITTVIASGIGAAPAKTGGQGREYNIPLPEVTIHIESGFYEEYFPIVVPENCSIKGDEFRRVTIQPYVGVRPPQRSLDMLFERGDLKKYDGSATLKVARYRNHYDSQYSVADTTSGINQIGSTQIRLKELVYYPLYGMYFEYNGTRYYTKDFTFDPASVGDFTRADIALYSDINLTTPTTLQDNIPNGVVIELKKLNQHMDAFLMNNTSILRNISVRRHQGFMMVLDPEGQILTKSPYVQTCSSFSGQGGGGQYVCGNAGVQYGTVVDNPATGTSITLTGLNRPIQLPTTFLFQGSGAAEKGTYRIIGATAPVDDGLGNGTFKSTLTLAAATPITADARTLPTGNIPQGTELRIETAGNKSMTSNDYTQVNSDGYGLVATNNGLVETVSVFTYYCDIAYWARNGGQIRSLNGSNAYGRIALQAEGSNPNENIQQGQVFFKELNATVEQDSTRRDGSMEVTMHNPSGTGATTGDTEIQVRDFDYQPISDSEFTLTPYSSNGDTTRYQIDEVEQVSVNITGITLTSECEITTDGNHYYRDGAMVFITGADANGMDDLDGVYYAKVTASNKFKLCTDTALTAFVDSSAKGDPSYAGSGAVSKGGGRALLKLGQALALGVGVTVADGSRFVITMGKNVYIRDLVDTPRVLPSSALQFATGDQQVFRILGTERFTGYSEINDPSFEYQLMNLDLNFPADRFNSDTVKVTTQISTLRATGHDFLNIGWGNYIDSNYPNNVFGAPAGRPDFAADQAAEAVEVGAGRVFYASTDQDGNFRVGRYFRVNQGDGSVELNAEISLTNVDGLGFTKGTVVDEFSTDDKMQGKSDDAVPTEASIVTYINSAIIGQHEDGTAVQEPTTLGAQTGGTFGLLNRAGYNASNLSWNKMSGELNMNNHQITNLQEGVQDTDVVTKNYTDNVFRGATTDSFRTEVKAFEMLNDSTLDSGAIDMNGNRVKSMRDPVDGSDAATKKYVDGQNRIGGLDSVVITGAPANTDLLMFNGQNGTNGNGDQTEGAVNVALDLTTNSTANSRTFGEPSGQGSDLRFTRINNQLNIQLAGGAVKNADVSAAAEIAQSKIAVNLATARTSDTVGGPAISAISLVNPIRITTSVDHNVYDSDQVTINNVIGTTQLNGNTYYAKRISANQIDLYSDALLTATINGTVGFTAYSSAGNLNNTRILRNASGVVSFDSDEFTLTNGWATLRTPTVSNPSTGVPFSKLSWASGNTMLGRAGVGAGPVVGLTASDIRSLIDFDTNVEAYIDENVLASNGGITQSGTNAMTGTLQTNAVRPTDDNLYAIGQQAARYTQTFSRDIITNNIQQHEPTGVQVEAPLLVLGNESSNPSKVMIISDDATTVSGQSGYTPGTITTTANLASTTTYENSVFIGKARRLETPRTIFITGSSSGNATFDGSEDITINVAPAINVGNPTDGTYMRRNGITDDSYALGTLGVQSVVPSAGTTGSAVPYTNVTADNTYDLGQSGNRFREVFAVDFTGTASSAKYADLAENYVADAEYEPGTVLMFGGSEEVTIGSGEGSNKVAGIVSTNPAYLMNSGLKENAVALGLQGRVPCKVIGKINKGDMLVISNVDGVATASADPKMGTVIGKALQDYDSDEIGTIEVVVGRM